MGAPNHATLPTQNILNAAIPDPEDCAKLKDEFGVHSNTHSKNKRGKHKKVDDALDLQSHHVLQDAQTDVFVSRGRAIAVILQDGHAGSEHGIITNRQNGRMNNKGGAGGPAATMGALKKEAGDDLVAGLAGKRKGKTTGKPITEDEAKALAKCLVAEAEKKAKEKSENDPDAEPITDATGVPPPAGCLTAGTPVRMADGSARPVEALRPGDQLWTPLGPCPLIRIDMCRHDLVELDVAGETLTIATFHRLLTASGAWKRADELGVGEPVMTVSGPRVVTGARRPVEWQTTYRLGFRRATVCAVGAAAVCASMPETGPVVVPYEPNRAAMDASP